jgi:hypothetical protein
LFKATGPEFDLVFDARGVREAITKHARSFAWVYPHEIICEGMYVDIAAMTWRKELYAFEIKERGDKISVGIEQCKQYLSGFDRVYLAGTVKPTRETLMRIERLGFGYVQVSFESSGAHHDGTPRTDAKLHCLLIAPLNHPISEVRAHMKDKIEKTIDDLRTTESPFEQATLDKAGK